MAFQCTSQIRALLSHITSDERVDRAMIAHLIVQVVNLNLILSAHQSNPSSFSYVPHCLH